MQPFEEYAITCRICLKIENGLNLSIHDQLNQAITFGEMLKLLLYPIEVDMNPKLPHKICLMCKDNLIKVYNLRQLCFTSDRLLKSTIYEAHLEINGSCGVTPNNSAIETLVIDDDDDDEDEPIDPNLFLRQFQSEDQELSSSEEPDKNKESDPPCELEIDQMKEKTVINRLSQTKTELSCKICRQQFETVIEHNRHLQQHNDGTLIEHKCEQCLVVYKSRQTFKQHFKTKRHQRNLKTLDANEYFCSKCQIHYTCIMDYSKHMLKHLRVLIPKKSDVFM